MQSIGLREPGSYNPYNQHGGVMPALPCELNITDSQAGMLMRKCYKAGGTKSQLESVRKMLSYFHQLMTKQREDNFPSVYFQFDCQDPLKYLQVVEKIIIYQ